MYMLLFSQPSWSVASTLFVLIFYVIIFCALFIINNKTLKDKKTYKTKNKSKITWTMSSPSIKVLHFLRNIRVWFLKWRHSLQSNILSVRDKPVLCSFILYLLMKIQVRVGKFVWHRKLNEFVVRCASKLLGILVNYLDINCKNNY